MFQKRLQQCLKKNPRYPGVSRMYWVTPLLINYIYYCLAFMKSPSPFLHHRLFKNLLPVWNLTLKIHNILGIASFHVFHALMMRILSKDLSICRYFRCIQPHLRFCFSPNLSSVSFVTSMSSGSFPLFQFSFISGESDAAVARH